MRARVGGLHACLRGFPAAALELSPDGTVLDSNGRLEELLGRQIVGESFAAVLDTSSKSKWDALLATRGSPDAGIWELVLECKATLELRTFAVIWGREHDEDALWLVEYARDLKLTPLYEELSAANTELVNAHRELAKERARLSRTLRSEAEAREAAQRARARLHALHAVSVSVRSSASQLDTAHQLLTGLTETLQADSAALLLFGESQTEMRVLATVGLEAGASEPVSFAVAGTFAGRVASARRSVIELRPATSDVSSALLRARASVVAGAPLIAGDHMLGVLRAAWVTPRELGDDDVQLLELVAADAAVAIERAQLLDAERAARAEAERAVRLRDEVLAIVAHDLKNPIARITTAAGMLGEEGLASQSRAELLAVLQRSGRLIDRLVRDLLDVARIDEGKLSLDRREIDLAALARDVTGSFAGIAAQRAVELSCTGAEDAILLSADYERLQQVLGNLLDNAVRLTPKDGRVSVTVERMADGARIAVADTGPGIAADDLPRLFDRFWQGARSRRGSAGLGLSIAKGIVDAHGGRIRVISTVGKGTTFFIELPRDAAVT